MVYLHNDIPQFLLPGFSFTTTCPTSTFTVCVYNNIPQSHSCGLPYQEHSSLQFSWFTFTTTCLTPTIPTPMVSLFSNMSYSHYYGLPLELQYLLFRFIFTTTHISHNPRWLSFTTTCPISNPMVNVYNNTPHFQSHG